jgi:predicted ABC-type ATPase
MATFTIIGGPNGAGKSTIFPSIQTFDRTEIPFEPGVIKSENFINADDIANKFNLNEVASARRTLSRLDELIEKGENLAMESTLSGRTLLKYIQKAIKKGYKIYLIYVFISSHELSATRVTQRALLGKHYIPLSRIIQRYKRSILNYQNHYLPLAYFWTIVDNSELTPKVMGYGGKQFRDIETPTEQNGESMEPYISKIREFGLTEVKLDYIIDDPYTQIVLDKIIEDVNVEISNRPKGNYVVIEKNGKIEFTNNFKTTE